MSELGTRVTIVIGCLIILIVLLIFLSILSYNMYLELLSIYIDYKKIKGLKKELVNLRGEQC